MSGPFDPDSYGPEKGGLWRYINWNRIALAIGVDQVNPAGRIPGPGSTPEQDDAFQDEQQQIKREEILRQAQERGVSPDRLHAAIQAEMPAATSAWERSKTARFPRKLLDGGVAVTVRVRNDWLPATVVPGGWDQSAGTVRVELDGLPRGRFEVVPVDPAHLMV